MSLQRSDILHATAVYLPATGEEVVNQGFRAFTRVGPGVYVLQLVEAIGARESQIEVRCGINEVKIGEGALEPPGLLTVRVYDTLRNPTDAIVLRVTVLQVQTGPVGTLPATPVPAPIVPTAPVLSVFGRIGNVVAELGDYVASLIGNDSSVVGLTVADALDALLAMFEQPTQVYWARPEAPLILASGARFLTAPDIPLIYGLSLSLPRAVLFSGVTARMGSFAPPPDASTLWVGLYQAANGNGSGVANLIASGSLELLGEDNYIIPMGAPGLLAPGTAYLLYGMTGGAGGLIFGAETIPNLQQATIQVPAGVHPLQFTTTLDPNAPPATFDPDDGGTGIAPSADIVPLFWLL